MGLEIFFQRNEGWQVATGTSLNHSCRFYTCSPLFKGYVKTIMVQVFKWSLHNLSKVAKQKILSPIITKSAKKVKVGQKSGQTATVIVTIGAAEDHQLSHHLTTRDQGIEGEFKMVFTFQMSISFDGKKNRVFQIDFPPPRRLLAQVMQNTTWWRRWMGF